MDHSYRWSDRLHRKREFSRVMRKGGRWTDRGLTLWVCRRAPPEGGARVSFAVPRAFGAAPRRNRLKRLLRETFRLHRHELKPGIDMIFGARPMEGALTLGRIEPVVMNLWNKAGVRPS